MIQRVSNLYSVEGFNGEVAFNVDCTYLFAVGEMITFVFVMPFSSFLPECLL